MAVILSTGLIFSGNKMDVNMATMLKSVEVKGIVEGTADASIKCHEDKGSHLKVLMT